MLKTINKAIFIFVSILSLSYFKTARAESIVPESGYKNGNYSLNDMVRVFINIGQWILGLVGSLALLMFVYGGFLFLFSGGNTDRVEKGKQTLTNAVIGLAVVFLSYMIIGMVFNFTDADPSGTAWSEVNWFSDK